MFLFSLYTNTKSNNPSLQIQPLHRSNYYVTLLRFSVFFFFFNFYRTLKMRLNSLSNGKNYRVGKIHLNNNSNENKLENKTIQYRNFHLWCPQNVILTIFIVILFAFIQGVPYNSVTLNYFLICHDTKRCFKTKLFYFNLSAISMLYLLGF